MIYFVITKIKLTPKDKTIKNKYIKLQLHFLFKFELKKDLIIICVKYKLIIILQKFVRHLV